MTLPLVVVAPVHSVVTASGSAAAAAAAAAAFSWKGAGQSLFSAPAAASAAGDEDVVQQADDVHFEPVVSLPEVADQRTGEEDDQVVFKQRAKLYRYTDGQWKERGVGDMKLLRHADSGEPMGERL